MIIERLDGTKFNLEKLGIRVIQFEPPSASYEYSSVQVGRRGQRLVGTTTGQRQIPFKCDVFASNNLTILLKRQQFFQIFDSQEPFYVIDSDLPTIRWKVVAEQQPFSFYENYSMGGDISFNLDCVDGYAESVDTTLNIDDMKKWSFGMNLPINQHYQYRFAVSKFKVFNASNIDILAEERPFDILFKGQANGLTINNLTTNQTFKYLGAINTGDQFVLHGAWPILNNKSVYADSNHGLIDLKRGWNDFQISGFYNNFEVGVDTHFYY